MTGTIKASVVICCYTTERLQDIHEAVDSVLAQTLKPHEVIVAVDHNEELFNRLKAECPIEVKLVLSTGAPGFSGTKNTAISYSSGEIIAFIDDDATAEKTWLENLILPFEDPYVMAVGGRTLPLWIKGKRPSWFPEELDWVIGCTYRGIPINGKNIRNVWGGNTAFRKEVFNKVGFFETKVGRYGKSQGVGEEADICLRIKNVIPNARILFESNAVIHHKVPVWRLSLRYLARRSYNEGYYKNIVERLSQGSSSKILTTENTYLRYLLFTSIPQRFRFFYKRGQLKQACVIIISITFTGFGYLRGKVTIRPV